MNAEDFLRKKELLAAFQALERNAAYTGELAPLFDRHFANALAGLRNRHADREKRGEYLQAAEDAEELQRFVERRVEELRRELATPPEEEWDG